MATVRQQVQFEIYGKTKTILFDNYGHDGYEPVSELESLQQSAKTHETYSKEQNGKSSDIIQPTSVSQMKNELLEQDQFIQVQKYVSAKQQSLFNRVDTDGEQYVTCTGKEIESDSSRGLKESLITNTKTLDKNKIKSPAGAKGSATGIRKKQTEQDTVRKTKDEICSKAKDGDQSGTSTIPTLPRITSQKSSAKFVPIKEKSLVRSMSFKSQPVPVSNKRSNWRLVGKLTKVISFLRRPERSSSRTNKEGYQPLLRFRRAVKTVQVLLRATVTDRQQAQRSDLKLISWAHYQLDQTKHRQTSAFFKLSFDPSFYRAKKENTVSNEAKVILSLDPEDRTEEQLHVALLALTQVVPSFGEFPIKMQKSLVRVGWYEHFEEQRVIIRQGHKADNFYFILSGTAIVTILETNKSTDEQFVRTVAFLKKGGSFGELALMHGARRSATVTCKEDVELLAVGREDFIDIFMHVEKNKEPEHIQFIRTVDILRGWPFQMLPYHDPNICLFTFFRRDSVLCQDSNTCEWIYVIKTGSCRVFKALDDTRPSLHFFENKERKTYHKKLPPIRKEFLSYSTSELGNDRVKKRKNRTGRIHNVLLKKGLPPIFSRSEEELRMSAEKHIKKLDRILEERDIHEEISTQHISTPKSSSRFPKKSESNKVFIQLQKLGPRDVFGLEPIVFDVIQQSTSCILVSDGAECILISKQFFKYHLSDQIAKRIRKSIRPITTEESLQQKLQDKTNWDAFKTLTLSRQVLHTKMLHDHQSLDY